jgi:hypothetical protein
MIAEVIARLEATCKPPLKLVQGAVEYAALAAPPPVARQPAAYVMPLGGSPGANTLAGSIRQRMQESVGVVVLLGNLRDARGDAAMDAIEPVYRAIRTALVGFVPEPGYEAMQLGPARLLDFADGVIAWQESFSTAYQQRSV